MGKIERHGGKKGSHGSGGERAKPLRVTIGDMIKAKGESKNDRSNR